MNGPEGVFDWSVVDWRVHEENVARLRRRIFKATREQDWAAVRSLQKLMLGSWSNTLRQCATGDSAQCWASNGRDRWGGCPVARGKSEHGCAGA